MQVRIADLVYFYKHNIAVNTNSIVELNARYANMKTIYDNEFIHKLLRWKYEDSRNGDRGWFGSWNFTVREDRIEDYKTELRKLDYRLKMKEVLIDLPEKYSHYFYKFAESYTLAG